MVSNELRESHPATGFPPGVAVALVTPFREDRSLDLHAAGVLAHRLGQAGLRHFVVSGTTGEAPSLTLRERCDLLLTVREATAETGAGPGEGVFITAGISAPTETAVLETLEALAPNADGFLLAPPPYVKPPQWAIEEFCRHVADRAPGPICLYHVPGRTSVGFETATLERLSAHPCIAGLKFADADLVRLTSIRQACGENLTVYSGEDALYLPMLALGAIGIVSVAAHVVPHRLVALTRCFAENDTSRARALFLEVFSTLQACFALTNPIPVKLWLYRLGLIPSPCLRSPLAPPSGEILEHLLARFDACPEDVTRTEAIVT